MINLWTGGHCLLPVQKNCCRWRRRLNFHSPNEIEFCLCRWLSISRQRSTAIRLRVIIIAEWWKRDAIWCVLCWIGGGGAPCPRRFFLARIRANVIIHPVRRSAADGHCLLAGRCWWSSVTMPCHPDKRLHYLSAFGKIQRWGFVSRSRHVNLIRKSPLGMLSKTVQIRS